MLRRRLLACLIASPALSGAGLSFAAAHGGEEKGAKKKGGGQDFIQLPTLTANATRANGRRGVLTVEGGLDIREGALRTKAQSSIPRLRAAYTETLQAQAAAIQPGSPPNPDALVLALQRTTDVVLGKPGARFLIGAVMIN
jgi:hypothetical protein